MKTLTIKKFLIKYTFADCTMPVTQFIEALNIEQAKAKLAKEISDCYGSYLASKLLIN